MNLADMEENNIQNIGCTIFVGMFVRCSLGLTIMVWV